MREVTFYKIKSEKFWDIKNAKFGIPTNNDFVVVLFQHGDIADEAYLRRTLEFYGYPVGPDLMTLEEVKAAKLAEINAACQIALERLTLTYPERELLTFDKQEKQARSLISGDKSDIGHITAIAQGRGITVEDLAQKIVAKADAFSLASGLLIGQRQKFEDLLDAADTVAAVAAIVPKYTMPEKN